jgi:hypothetical protein
VTFSWPRKGHGAHIDLHWPSGSCVQNALRGRVVSRRPFPTVAHRVHLLFRFHAYREDKRQDEIQKLTSTGIVPSDQYLEKYPEKSMEARPWLMGRVAAVINVSDTN